MQNSGFSTGFSPHLLQSLLLYCSFWYASFCFSRLFSFNFIPIGIVSLGCFFRAFSSCHSFRVAVASIGIFSVKVSYIKSCMCICTLVQCAVHCVYICKCLILCLCRRHSTICKHSHTVIQTMEHTQKWCHRTICLAFSTYFMYESFLFLNLVLILISFLHIHIAARSGYDQFSFVISCVFFSLLSLVILSDLANEQDEAFSDAVSQTKPTTVTSSHLWVLNYKSEVKLNVLPLHVRFLFPGTFCDHFVYILFAFACDGDYTCTYVCLYACVYAILYTIRIRGLSICSFAIHTLRGAPLSPFRSLSLRAILLAQIFNLSSPFEQLLTVPCYCLAEL